MDKRVKSVLQSSADWAAGGEAPSREMLSEVLALEPPRIEKPSEARDYLWSMLSYPERGRALAVLHAVNLLEELFPSWTTDIPEQDLRLRTVEEVHLERWACGLSETAFKKICSFHDEAVRGGLNGWALTGLAALLVRVSDQLPAYLSGLRLDLTSLGATDEEIERVCAVVGEFPLVFEALARAEHKSFRVLPATAVIALSALFADGRFDDEHITASIHAADKWVTHS